MASFLYDTKTLQVLASAEGLTISPLPAGQAIVVLDHPLVGLREKCVDRHPNPTCLVDNPDFGAKLGLTCDARDTDGDNVPDIACGSGTARFTVQLLGKENYTPKTR